MKHNKLCLGTVQFGLKYGVNNKIGKPDTKSIFEILDTALEYGIEYYDTASAYGDAEEQIGKYIRERKKETGIKIISKLKPNLQNGCSGSLKHLVVNEVKRSLSNLHFDVLEGYLLHDQNDFYNHEIMEGLFECKERGFIKHVGISAYDLKPAKDAIQSGRVDFVQVPYNIFDRRLDNELASIARERGVLIFARSAFLQGLLLMKSNELPNHLSFAKSYIEKFESIIDKYEVNRLEIAFLFAYENVNVDYVVFGIDSKEQLLQNVHLVNKAGRYKECIDELKQEFLRVEDKVIFPYLWTKN